MTQDHLKLLSLISLSCLCLTLFQIPTLICMALGSFFTYKYLKSLMAQHLSRGLIKLCSERLRNQLLNRSIFDFVCTVWFEDWGVFLRKFFKLLFKPLVEPIEPQNAHQALQDLDQETRKIYLTKGVVRVMPQFCQKMILGSEKTALQVDKIDQQKGVEVKLIKHSSSERYTRDKSSQEEPVRLIRVNSESQFNNCSRMVEQHWSGKRSSHGELIRRQLEVGRARRPKSKGLLHTINKSLGMLKKLLEMQNIGTHVHRLNTGTIIKLMLVFWVALLVQIKFNRSARRTVIKTLYVMGGIVTVLGVAGTTGILLYKHSRKTQRKSSQISQLEY